MKNSFPKSRALNVATFLLVTAVPPAAISAQIPDGWPMVPAANASTSGGADRYIVRFVEPPLALHASELEAKKAGSFYKVSATGRRRLDVKNGAALAYVQYLSDRQQIYLAGIREALQLGSPPPVLSSMQHAANAAVLKLTESDAEKIRKIPGVEAVERVQQLPLATEIGPRHIGASSLWWGTASGSDTLFASSWDRPGHLGEGVVVGVIDSGYNSLSPSFQPSDNRGYTMRNPLGDGNFLGHCSRGSGAAGISLAGCNAKVIGAYDAVTLSTGASTGYSAEDTVGHGSHTASIAAGNFREAKYRNLNLQISGVAPHANLVIYKACSSNMCGSDAIVKSVDLAVADGAVDVLNLSISGSGSPWAVTIQKTLLAATESGIFVAAAAGNTSDAAPLPEQGSVNNISPWITTVAAGTHTGGGADGAVLQIRSAAPVPAGLDRLYLNHIEGSKLLAAAITADIRMSPSFGSSGANQDGCASYAADLFAGSIAFINRGSCPTKDAVEHAIAAGALAVVVKNSRPSDPLYFDGLVAQPAVPVFWLSQEAAEPLQAYLSASSLVASSVVAMSRTRDPLQADKLADFSLRGPGISLSPVFVLDVIKPDIQAPGVNILAAVHNRPGSGGPGRVDMMSGTSMAAPHVAGAAALLKGLRPNWSPSEIKSALMMTSTSNGLTTPDGKAPTTFFERGSGSARVFSAAQAGLVLDETASRYLAANPSSGGDPSSLNLASMQNLNCPTRCSFERRFRSTVDRPVTWTASVLPGNEPGLGIAFSASTFVVPANAVSEPLTIRVDLTGLSPSDSERHFAEVLLVPNDPGLASLRLPLVVSRSRAEIYVGNSDRAITFTSSQVSGGNPQFVGVFNLGDEQLTVTRNTQAGVNLPVGAQSSDPVFGIYESTGYSEAGNAYQRRFAADDFSVEWFTTQITKLRVSGSLESAAPGASLGGLATSVHWRIYRDVQGWPDSYPGADNAAVFKADLALGAAGLDVSGNDLSLDLVAAGLEANLPEGRYWLVVYPTLPCDDRGRGCTNVWYRKGALAVSAHGFMRSSGESSGWVKNSLGGLEMTLESRASCNEAPWGPNMTWSLSGVVSNSPLPMQIPGSRLSTLNVRAVAPLGPLPSRALVCLGSNDPRTPVLPITVNVVQ
ncbi:MAG: S8 family serine peptidase [Rhodanobacteraceae bacterium]|nr:S8 family serine peptidase [Rhodanobacteraceae bacterium]